MAAPLILARTFKDAHAYASDVLGLRFGNYRVVNSVGTIKATRGADLHLVPGWDKRPDRFTMKGALRYARHNIIDASAPAQEPAPADERWADTSYTRTIAERYNAVLDASNTLETDLDEPKPEPADLPGPLEDSEGLFPAPTEDSLHLADAESLEPPRKRRRRKCADCEQLHYKGDPCIDSEAL